MDLNRQALLVTALAVLAPAVVDHAVRPGRLADTIRRQALLPGSTAGRPIGRAYAALLVGLELVVVASCLVALGGTAVGVAGALLVGTGLAFVCYVATLLARRYRGDCGCSPIGTTLTRLSLVPGSLLLAAGALLVPGRGFDDVAFARTSGALQTTLALAAAAVLGGLVSLLPASALVGDPMTLSGED